MWNTFWRINWMQLPHIFEYGKVMAVFIAGICWFDGHLLKKSFDRRVIDKLYGTWTMETLNMVREEHKYCSFSCSNFAHYLAISLLLRSVCSPPSFFFFGFLDDCGEVIALFKLQNLRLWSKSFCFRLKKSSEKALRWHGKHLSKYASSTGSTTGYFAVCREVQDLNLQYRWVRELKLWQLLRITGKELKSSRYCVKNKIRTGDGQNNGKPGQYRNKTVCAGCTERILIYLSLFFRLFTLCIACVSAIQIVLSNGSYESTAKWETCHISKEDRLLLLV